MSYIPTLLIEFNILFQFVTSLLYKLKSEVERLLKNKASNYMVLNYVKSLENIFEIDETNSQHFVKQEDIYIGMDAYESIFLVE